MTDAVQVLRVVVQSGSPIAPSVPAVGPLPIAKVRWSPLASVAVRVIALGLSSSVVTVLGTAIGRPFVTV